MPQHRWMSVLVLGMTPASCMSTSRALGMPLGTGITAIGLIIDHHGSLKIYDTQTGRTGTFHLRNSGRHRDSPSKVQLTLL
jgi:hypothetical protein